MRDQVILVICIAVGGLFGLFLASVVLFAPYPGSGSYIPYNVSRDACMQFLSSGLRMGTYCWDLSGNCSLPGFRVGDSFNVSWFVNGSEYVLTCYWFELGNVSGYDWVLEVNGSDVAGCAFLCCGYRCHGDVDYAVKVVRGG